MTNKTAVYPQQTIDKLIAITCANKGRHTARGYTSQLTKFFDWLNSNGRPITATAVIDYIAERGEGGASAATVNLSLSAIREMARAMAANGIDIDGRHDDILSIANVKGERVRHGNWLTGEQVKQLLSLPDRTTIKGVRDYAILITAFSTGLRRAELCSLQYSNIERIGGQWELTAVDCKGGAVRSLPISSEVKNALCHLNYKTAALYGFQCMDGWIFTGVNSGDNPQHRPAPMTTGAIYKIIKSYGELIGIAIAPHDVRRSFARLLHENGHDLIQIGDALGHKATGGASTYIGDAINKYTNREDF